jgi:hypothetical protein
MVSAFDIRHTAHWSFETARFFVGFYTEPEDMDPADCFECQADIDAVRNGSVDWFCAAVRVYLKADDEYDWQELSADCLGGCAYQSARDFYTQCRDGYFRDMVREAVRVARLELARLGDIAQTMRA